MNHYLARRLFISNVLLSPSAIRYVTNLVIKPFNSVRRFNTGSPLSTSLLQFSSTQSKDEQKPTPRTSSASASTQNVAKVFPKEKEIHEFQRNRQWLRDPLVPQSYKKLPSEAVNTTVNASQMEAKPGKQIAEEEIPSSNVGSLSSSSLERKVFLFIVEVILLLIGMVYLWDYAPSIRKSLHEK